MMWQNIIRLNGTKEFFFLEKAYEISNTLTILHLAKPIEENLVLRNGSTKWYDLYMKNICEINIPKYRRASTLSFKIIFLAGNQNVSLNIRHWTRNPFHFSMPNICRIVFLAQIKYIRLDPFLVLRRNSFLCLKLEKWYCDHFRVTTSKNPAISGLTSEKRRTIITDLRRLIIFVSFVCRCSSFFSKTVCLYRLLGMSIINDLKKYFL